MDEDIFEQQEQIREDKKRLKLEAPGVVTVMKQGASSQMNWMREEIATKMWCDYVQYTRP